MVLSLLGLVFLVSTYGYSSSNVETEFRDNEEHEVLVADDYVYNEVLSITDTGGNMSLRTDGYDFYDFSAHTYFSYQNATYNLDLGNYGIGFDYDSVNGSRFYCRCFVDNSDYRFYNYNIIPVFNFKVSLYTTQSWEYTFYNTFLNGEATQTDDEVYYEWINQNLSNASIQSVRIKFGFLVAQSVDTSQDYNDGYNLGYDNGYNKGVEDTFNSSEIQNIKSTSYQEGFDYAKSIYDNQNAVASSIFSGILNIGLIPISFLMSIFNFEIFGINISDIVSALITIAVVVILLKIILGKSNDK